MLLCLYWSLTSLLKNIFLVETTFLFSSSSDHVTLWLKISTDSYGTFCQQMLYYGPNQHLHIECRYYLLFTLLYSQHRQFTIPKNVLVFSAKSYCGQIRWPKIFFPVFVCQCSAKSPQRTQMTFPPLNFPNSQSWIIQDLKI